MLCVWCRVSGCTKVQWSADLAVVYILDYLVRLCEFEAAVDGNDSAGEVAVFDVSPACAREFLGKVTLVRPGNNRLRKVFVGFGV